MKKFIVLAFIIALIAAAPWYIGLQAQKELETQVQQIESYPGYNAEITEYNRGLLSSSAKLKISYDISLAPQLEDRDQKFMALMKNGVLLKLDIAHGPILTKPQFSGGLSYTEFTLDDSQEFISETEKVFGVDELVIANTQFGFDGKGTGSVNIPVLTHKEDNSNFSFGGANIAFDLAEFGKKQKSTGTIEAISFSSEYAQIEVSPITLSGESAKGDSLYGTGNFNLKLAKLKVTAEKSVALENLDIAVDVRNPSSGMMDVDYKINLAALSGSTPPFELKDTVFDLSLKNIKESAFEKFINLSKKADLAVPSAIAAHQENMNAAMTDFLAGSPEIIVNNFAFTLGEDNWMDLKGSLVIDGAIAGKPEAQGNPMMLIPAVNANYTANLSKGLIDLGMQQYLAQQFSDSGMSPDEIEQMKAAQTEQTALMIEQFVGMGFLKPTEKGYQIETSFKEGQFLVNGNPMPLPL